MFNYLSDNLYFSVEKGDEQIIKRVQVGLKRKENEKEKEALRSHQKKKCRKRSEVQSKPEKKKSHATSELSDSDKKLLDRWKNMQTNTKPFIHPIRKYMSDIVTLKKETETGNTTMQASCNDNSIVETSGGNTQHYQFTTYRSEKGEGECLKAVKDSTQPEHGTGAEAMLAASLLGKTLSLIFIYKVFFPSGKSLVIQHIN